jgi:hypothetical protein
MAEALAAVALTTIIATADADNSRQQTTINNRLGAGGSGSIRGSTISSGSGIVAV